MNRKHHKLSNCTCPMARGYSEKPCPLYIFKVDLYVACEPLSRTGPSDVDTTCIFLPRIDVIISGGFHV